MGDHKGKSGAGAITRQPPQENTAPANTQSLARDMRILAGTSIEDLTDDEIRQALDAINANAGENLAEKYINGTLSNEQASRKYRDEKEEMVRNRPDPRSFLARRFNVPSNIRKRLQEAVRDIAVNPDDNGAKTGLNNVREEMTNGLYIFGTSIGNMEPMYGRQDNQNPYFFNAIAPEEFDRFVDSQVKLFNRLRSEDFNKNAIERLKIRAGSKNLTPVQRVTAMLIARNRESFVNATQARIERNFERVVSEHVSREAPESVYTAYFDRVGRN